MGRYSFDVGRSHPFLHTGLSRRFRLFVPGGDGNVRVWDARSGVEMSCVDHGTPAERRPWFGVEDAVLGVSSGATAVAVSPDGTRLATGDAISVVRVRALAAIADTPSST